MRKFKTILVIAIFSMLLSSCSDFLAKNPNPSGNKPLSTLKDLDLLFNNPKSVLDWSTSGGLSALLSDDYGVNLDVYNSMKGFVPYISSLYKAIYDKPNIESDAMDWKAGLERLYSCNLVITKCADLRGDEKVRERLKAQAMSLRAFYHFRLMVDYCLWQDDAPGIGYFNSVSEQASYKRNTVSYTKQNIISDLLEAEKLFKESGDVTFNEDRNWEMSLPATYAVMARFYLYYGEYIKSEDYAKKALSAYSEFEDLNGKDLIDIPSFGWPDDIEAKSLAIAGDANRYLLWKGVFMPTLTSNVTFLFPSKEVLDLYDGDDLRYQYYIKNKNKMIPPFMIKVDQSKVKDSLYMAGYYKFGSPMNSGSLSDAPSVEEMLLIRAECAARKGDKATALNDIKQLRSHRFADPSKFTTNKGVPLTGSVSDVLDERRREFTFSSRWYDLKRLNALKADPSHPNGIYIKRVVYTDLEHKSDLQTITLEPNGKSYAIPIPSEELSNLGWGQNESGGVVKTPYTK